MILKKYVLFLSLLFCSISYSQTKEGLQICLAIQSSSLISDIEADKALDRILNTIGASKSFVLQSCDNIENAIATSYKGTRYILYDKAFMNKINENSNDWSNLFILAHEVGHHINGHSLDILLYMEEVVDLPELEKIRKQELEADEFAGFVLANLGASQEELYMVLSQFSNDNENSYSTHPNRQKRLASVNKGFQKAMALVKTKEIKTDSKIESYIQNTNYTKTGDWYVEETNNVFEGQEIKSVTKGKIMGNEYKLNTSPNLVYWSEKLPNGSYSSELFLEINYRELFEGLSALYGKTFRGSMVIDATIVILNATNEVIFNRKTYLPYTTGEPMRSNDLIQYLDSNYQNNTLVAPGYSDENIILSRGGYNKNDPYADSENDELEEMHTYLKNGSKLLVRFDGYYKGNTKLNALVDKIYDSFTQWCTELMQKEDSEYCNRSKGRWFDNYEFNLSLIANKKAYTEAKYARISLKGQIEQLNRIISEFNSVEKTYTDRAVIQRFKELNDDSFEKVDKEYVDLTDVYLEYSLKGSSKAIKSFNN